MLVKKNVQCKECKDYVNFYIEEKQSLKGLILRCQCGAKVKCADYHKFIPKWIKI